MPHIDVEILAPFAAKFLEGSTLTPAERAEVLRMAQGSPARTPRRRRACRPRPSGRAGSASTGSSTSPGPVAHPSLLTLSLKMLSRGDRIEPRPVVASQPVQQEQPSSTPAVLAR